MFLFFFFFTLAILAASAYCVQAFVKLVACRYDAERFYGKFMMQMKRRHTIIPEIVFNVSERSVVRLDDPLIQELQTLYQNAVEDTDMDSRIVKEKQLSDIIEKIWQGAQHPLAGNPSLELLFGDIHETGKDILNSITLYNETVERHNAIYHKRLIRLFAKMFGIQPLAAIAY